MRAALRLSTGALLGLVLTACGDSGVAALRLELNEDFSGTLTASSLLVPAEGGRLEGAVDGVAWGARARLSCSQGTFASIDGLRVADLAFEAGKTKAGFSYLQVTMPRAAARWPALVLPGRGERAAVDAAFDPNGDFGAASKALNLQLDVPGRVQSNTLTPSVRGMTADQTKNRATLQLPIDPVLKGGGPLVWLITWQ